MSSLPDPARAARVQRPHRPWRLDWARISTRWLPFADAASNDLPLSRLLRLALFQVSVGMATALLIGTLNRVMIVELGVAAWLVALMAAVPLVAAPFRALIGFRSDVHRSALGWRRVPYVWMGTMLQFGGLAIMPFALLVLSGQGQLNATGIGPAAACLAILMVGLGLQTTQTAGLALATDLAAEATRPRVVALMYVMLLLGMVTAGLVFGVFLSDYSHTRLVQVVQGAALLTMVLNVVAVWKQEPRRPGAMYGDADGARAFSRHWQAFRRQGRVGRFLLAVGLGSAAFSMQDIILEPYGGEVLHMGVGATAMLTAWMSLGALLAFFWASRRLARGANAYQLAALGVCAGLPAFSLVVFAEPLGSTAVFCAGTALIGFGGGLFAVATLTAAMGLQTSASHAGLALGAWGAVQATCTGAAIALGGALRDVVSVAAMRGWLGEALVNPATGYSFVYHLELALLFATLIVIGPLVRDGAKGASVGLTRHGKFGLAEMPT
jgi:BCD family chlorophyll transporter-like MFS transporter